MEAVAGILALKFLKPPDQKTFLVFDRISL
jgi:hypothetical protein